MTEQSLDSNKTKNRILFVTPYENGFIENDFIILSKKNIINKNIYDWQIAQNTPIYLLRQFVYLLLNINKNDKIIIEFAGYWSLLPSLFGKILSKPVMVICHGTDCASLPSLKYGSFNKRFLKTFCKLTYKLADIICPVSDSLIKTKNTFHNNEREELQGILAFIPNLKTPFKVIHNGIDIDYWKSENNDKIPNSFLAVFSKNQFYLKGGDLILEVAKELPNYTFKIAGTEKPKNLNNIPRNVIFLGKLRKERLKEEYKISEFYFQLSTFEGFGLSLCEAMLNGCIPIGSSSNIIPEIIGESGYVLKERKSHKLKIIINKALDSENKKIMANKGRQSIMERFSLKNRTKKLLQIIEIM
jgi:glycosyltransferase involved in cell wall biosynthesis